LSGTRLELSPSWSLACAIVLLHALAAASIVVVLETPTGYSLGACLLALGLAAAWGRALHRSSASVRALELSGNEVTLEMKDGRKLPAALGAPRHVSRFMVTLPARRPVRRTILVTRDMLGGEEFRRLRLWALWGKLPVRSERVACKQLSASAAGR
jgi:hypothetical protein